MYNMTKTLCGPLKTLLGTYLRVPIGDLYILTPLGLIQRSGLGAYIFIGSPIIVPILVQHLGPVIQGSHLGPSNVGTLTGPWSHYALDPKTN